MNRPIFVIGTSRSGTSILLQALGAHKLILSARGEAPLISFTGNFMASFKTKNQMVHNSYLEDSIKIPRKYLDASLRRLNFEIAFGKNYGFRRIAKTLLFQGTTFVKKRYWAAKIFSDEESSRGLRLLYPQASFIYIVRNGLSVVQSRMHFSGFKHEGFKDHCCNWRNDGKKYAYLEKMDNAVHLYYEELLEDPDQFFHTIFQTLNIPPDKGPAEYVKNNLVHPLNQADKKGVEVKKILQSRPAPYENWSKEEKAMFKEICMQDMEKHGYGIPF